MYSRLNTGPILRPMAPYLSYKHMTCSMLAYSDCFTASHCQPIKNRWVRVGKLKSVVLYIQSEYYIHINTNIVTFALATCATICCYALADEFPSPKRRVWVLPINIKFSDNSVSALRPPIQCMMIRHGGRLLLQNWCYGDSAIDDHLFVGTLFRLVEF
jgi:hypothetical protein